MQDIEELKLKLARYLNNEIVKTKSTRNWANGKFLEADENISKAEKDKDEYMIGFWTRKADTYYKTKLNADNKINELEKYLELTI